MLELHKLHCYSWSNFINTNQRTETLKLVREYIWPVSINLINQVGYTIIGSELTGSLDLATEGKASLVKSLIVAWQPIHGDAFRVMHPLD